MGSAIFADYRGADIRVSWPDTAEMTASQMLRVDAGGLNYGAVAPYDSLTEWTLLLWPALADDGDLWAVGPGAAAFEEAATDPMRRAIKDRLRTWSRHRGAAPLAIDEEGSLIIAEAFAFLRYAHGYEDTYIHMSTDDFTRTAPQQKMDIEAELCWTLAHVTPGSNVYGGDKWGVVAKGAARVLWERDVYSYALSSHPMEQALGKPGMPGYDEALTAWQSSALTSDFDKFDTACREEAWMCPADTELVALTCSRSHEEAWFDHMMGGSMKAGYHHHVQRAAKDLGVAFVFLEDIQLSAGRSAVPWRDTHMRVSAYQHASVVGLEPAHPPRLGVCGEPAASEVKYVAHRIMRNAGHLKGWLRELWS